MTSPMILIARPGPGERLAPDHPLRQAELLADAAHLVLEEEAERLDELHLHVGRKPADVVVRLDERGDAVLAAAGLDDVRVERPLDEEAHVAEASRASSSKTRMNSSPTILRFSSGSETPASRVRKRFCACTWTSGHVEVAAERLHDLLGLVLAQEAVVDEDARELVADRLVHEERRDRGVDSAGERAEHALASRRPRGSARPAPR